jgi:hypothetical protein
MRGIANRFVLWEEKEWDIEKRLRTNESDSYLYAHPQEITE